MGFIDLPQIKGNAACLSMWGVCVCVEAGGIGQVQRCGLCKKILDVRVCSIQPCRRSQPSRSVLQVR